MALRAWRIHPSITAEIQKAKPSDRIQKVTETLMYPGFFKSITEII
jgi:hypothetical protein